MTDDTDQETITTPQGNEIPEPIIHFHVEPEDIDKLASKLERAEGAEPEEEPTDRLAAFVESLKRLESAAEDARKEIMEPALHDRVTVGESIGKTPQNPRPQRRRPGFFNRTATWHR